MKRFRLKIPKLNKAGRQQIMSRFYNRTNGKGPDALMWIGTGLVVAGTVIACKNSMELPALISEYKAEKARIEATPQEEQKKEERKLKVRTAGKVLKLYALPAGMEFVGLVDMHSSNRTLKVVNTELMATCAGLSEGWRKYRKATIERFGKEADEEIMQGEWEEKEIPSDKPEETTEERVHTGNGMPSPYARWFCFGEADGAERNADYNRRFLKNQEDLANTYLRANKKMYLNELYEMLGIRTSLAGNRVGWIYDKNAPSGDNRVKLRVQEYFREREDMPGEYEIAFLIDPNVEGVIDGKALAMGLIDE